MDNTANKIIDLAGTDDCFKGATILGLGVALGAGITQMIHKNNSPRIMTDEELQLHEKLRKLDPFK